MNEKTLLQINLLNKTRETKVACESCGEIFKAELMEKVIIEKETGMESITMCEDCYSDYLFS